MSWKNFAARGSDAKDECDIVVVGAGMSGLTSAALLAARGYKVIVVEQHDIAGGSIHSFKQGSEWVCAGWHYVGRLPSRMRKVWEEITMDQPQHWDEKSVYDTYYTDELKAGLCKENFQQLMGIPIGAYRKLSAYSAVYVMVKLLPYVLARIVWALYCLLGWKKEATMPYGDWCKLKSGQTTENPVWWTQRGDHGMKKEDTIALVHGVITDHYYRGVVHVEGGITTTVERICKNIKNHGGHVYVKAPVSEIVLKNGAVSAVVVDNTEIKCKKVIVCGVHAAAKMLKETPPELKLALTLGPSIQHGCIFLTFTGKTAADLDIKPGNMWAYDTIFISWKESPTGVVVYVIWETEFYPRGEGYEDRKESEADHAMKLALKVYPKLAQHDEYDASTPATTQHYLMSEAGGSYGLSQPKARFDNFAMVRALKPEVSSVPGLYLTGQDTLFPGVSTAMVEGALTANCILYPGVKGIFRNIFSDVAKRVERIRQRNEAAKKTA